MAAVGLHLLMVQLWPQLELLHLQINEGSTLQVELVEQAAKRLPDPAPQTKASEDKEVFETAAIERLNRDRVQIAQANRRVQNKQQEPETPKKRKVVTDDVSYASAATPGAIPVDIQQTILARITYPLRARRKGWQGVASFDLDIRSQQLARLDLRRSSGYEVLDQAAMRGIRAVGSLPLADGVYQLPVEFRLQ